MCLPIKCSACQTVQIQQFFKEGSSLWLVVLWCLHLDLLPGQALLYVLFPQQNQITVIISRPDSITVLKTYPCTTWISFLLFPLSFLPITLSSWGRHQASQRDKSLVGWWSEGSSLTSNINYTSSTSWLALVEILPLLCKRALIFLYLVYVGACWVYFLFVCIRTLLGML